MALNPQNLKPCTPENARERQQKAAEKRKENTAKKKLFSQIYAEFLAKEYDVKTADGKKAKMTGADLFTEVVKKIAMRGDNTTIALMKEMREATEGNKVQFSGTVKSDMMTTEERRKRYEELIGGD